MENNEQLMAVLTLATVLAPFVTAVVQLLKSTFSIKNNWIPMIALAVGLVLGFISYPLFTDFGSILRLWAGGIAGLSSVGLFEIIKFREGSSK